MRLLTLARLAAAVGIAPLIGGAGAYKVHSGCGTLAQPWIDEASLILRRAVLTLDAFPSEGEVNPVVKPFLQQILGARHATPRVAQSLRNMYHGMLRNLNSADVYIEFLCHVPGFPQNVRTGMVVPSGRRKAMPKSEIVQGELLPLAGIGGRVLLPDGDRDQCYGWSWVSGRPSAELDSHFVPLSSTELVETHAYGVAISRGPEGAARAVRQQRCTGSRKPWTLIALLGRLINSRAYTWDAHPKKLPWAPDAFRAKFYKPETQKKSSPLKADMWPASFTIIHELVHSHANPAPIIGHEHVNGLPANTWDTMMHVAANSPNGGLRNPASLSFLARALATPYFKYWSSNGSPDGMLRWNDEYPIVKLKEEITERAKKGRLTKNENAVLDRWRAFKKEVERGLSAKVKLGKEQDG